MSEHIFWDKKTETLPREEIESLQLKRFIDQMQRVYKHSPFYRRKFDQAKIKPADIKTLDDVREVPFTYKEELRESQVQVPPFGDFGCIKTEEAVRVFQTSGTTGQPVKILLNAEDWYHQFFFQFMHHMYAYGITSKDVMYVPFHYGLHIAWWGFQTALEKAGVMIVPGGGQNTKNRIQAILDWGATVVCGTPTYVLYMAEVAKEMGLDLAKSKVRVVVVAGEPGANVPSTKKAIEKAWNAKCFDDIGSTEITNFAYECQSQSGTHLVDSMFLTESLDPETLQPVGEGENGEMVISNLTLTSMPLLRYRIKDLVRLNKEPCACGRTFARLDGGILGRSDDMFHFGGVNIFPSAIENIIREIEEFSTEYQVIIPKQGSGKHLKLRVEPASEGRTVKEIQEAIQRLTDTVKYRISITPAVEIAKVGSLPRFEGKAKRVLREEG